MATGQGTGQIATGGAAAGDSTESTLSLARTELQQEIGHFLGYTRASEKWSSGELADINAALGKGLRQFYFPPILQGENLAHEWSFLRPVDTLTTENGVKDYDMPADFGGIDGPMTFAATTGYPPVAVVGEGQIRQLRQRTSISDRPQLVAIRPKESTGSAGQRFEALFYPTPNAAFTLAYRKIILANALTSDAPYPLGGMAHAETLLASCLAAAESQSVDGQTTKWQFFIQRLTASISHDRKANSQEYFGYCGDNSDYNHDVGTVRRGDCRVTYDGEPL